MTTNGNEKGKWMAGVRKFSFLQYFQGLASGLMWITQGLICTRCLNRKKSAAKAELLRVLAALQ